MSEDNKSQAEGSEVEEEKLEPPHPVTTDQLVAGLSMIQRTHDGCSFAFASLTMEETDPPVETLEEQLKQYEHIQHLQLAKNGIRDIDTIQFMPHLLTVNVSTNAIASIKFLEECAGQDKLLSLQRLDLSTNKIKEMCAIPQPKLSWLNLSQNAIKSCADFAGHAELITFLFAENKLANCAGIGAMPKLQELNLSGNALKSISDLKDLDSLKKLDVSKNKLENLDAFPILPALEYFDASENLIEANGEQALKSLSECRKLKTIIMAGNPWVDEKGDDFKKEILMTLDMLRVIQVNEMDPVTDEDRLEAKTEKVEREKARAEAAEEARKAAEEAAEEAKKEAEAAAAEAAAEAAAANPEAEENNE